MARLERTPSGRVLADLSGRPVRVHDANVRRASGKRAGAGRTGRRAELSNVSHEKPARPGLTWGLACTLASLSLATGCATPGPVNYYAKDPPALPTLGEEYRLTLIDELAAGLVEGRIQLVELIEDRGTRRVSPIQGRSADFEQFPLAALQAASLAAGSESCGAELDVLVGTEPGVMVKVRHDVDESLHVLMGRAPMALREGEHSAVALKHEFGIGPLIDHGVAWSDADRRALGTALALLDREELAYLHDLPFVRMAGAEDGEHAGFFHVGQGAEGGRIILLDLAFGSDGQHFVGPPERAYPRSIFVILHEIGHAVAELDRIMLIAIFERDRARYNEAVVVANQYVDALNVRYAVVDRLAKSRDRLTVKRDIRTLEKEYRRIKRIMRDAKKRLEDLSDKIQGPPPMTVAYGALANAKLGPTHYGRTSIDEGFAEAFALYHLDPTSVERFSPEVHAWFAGDHHLAAALYPPLDAFEPPPRSSAAPHTRSEP